MELELKVKTKRIYLKRKLNLRKKDLPKKDQTKMEKSKDLLFSCKEINDI
jgi:hypothetical protein